MHDGEKEWSKTEEETDTEISTTDRDRAGSQRSGRTGSQFSMFLLTFEKYSGQAEFLAHILIRQSAQ